MSAILVDGTALCYCGKRRGLHRYGDECCPNPRWSCGNGEDQWWTHRRFVAIDEPMNGLDMRPVLWHKGAAPQAVRHGVPLPTTVVVKGQPA